MHISTLATDGPERTLVGARWRALLIVVYVAQWIGLAVVLALISPYIGEGTSLGVLMLFVIAWFTLSQNGILILGPTWPRRIVAILVPLIGIELLYQTEASLLIDWALKHPPPKPMFHRFQMHERALLPFWHQPYPYSDRAQHLAFCDTAENALLVLPRFKDWSRWYPDFGIEATLIFIPGQTYPIKVRQFRDAMVVISRDGSCTEFSLPPFGAASLAASTWDEDDSDILRAALGWVLEFDRGRLMQLLDCDQDP